jgi:hypothetical protein
MLMLMDEPMQFEAIELSIQPIFETVSTINSYDYRTEAILIIQDRSLPLTQRFISLNNYLFDSTSYPRSANPLSIAFRTIPFLMSHFESSLSISDYCIASQEYFRLNDPLTLSTETTDTIIQRYLGASVSLEAVLPNWQVLFEQLIVNHMFFNHFSLSEDKMSVQDDFLSLITMYSFLIFNLLGNLPMIRNPELLVDYLAAMFRVVEHSNFRAVAAKLYRSNYSLDPEYLVS